MGRMRPARRSGFTLIEVMVVISIIAILASLLGFAVSGLRNRAKAQATQALLKKIGVALQTYYNEFQEYPPDGYDAPVVVTLEGADLTLVGSQCLIYYLGEAIVKEYQVGSETRTQTVGPLLSWEKRDLTGNSDMAKRLGVWEGTTPRHDKVLIADAWGNPIMYDNVEEDARFTDLTPDNVIPDVEGLPAKKMVHGPDPRADTGKRRNHNYDLYSHGIDVTSTEDNLTNWKD